MKQDSQKMGVNEIASSLAGTCSFGGKEQLFLCKRTEVRGKGARSVSGRRL